MSIDVKDLLRQYLSEEDVERVFRGEAHAVFRQPSVHSKITVRCFENLLENVYGYTRRQARIFIAAGDKAYS